MKGELLKQWQQDVEYYGVDGAITLWVERGSNGVDYQFDGCIEAFSNHRKEWIKRKQSAELPFNLERAKCGDDVEFYIELEKIQEDVKFIKQYDTLNIAMCVKNGNRLINFDDLRMKYPPKVKK